MIVCNSLHQQLSVKNNQLFFFLFFYNLPTLFEIHCEKNAFISMHVSKKNVPLRELCPKKMSQREENARINTTDDLEQFGHKLWQF